MPNKMFLKWSDIDVYMNKITDTLKEEFIPDVIVSVGRGGMIPTRIISDYFLKSDVVHIPYRTYEVGGYVQTKQEPIISFSILDDIIKYKNILLVDDISDSGKTLSRCSDIIRNYKNIQSSLYHIRTSTIITKKIWQPDYPGLILDNEDWIVFPWEKNEFGKEGV